MEMRKALLMIAVPFFLFWGCAYDLFLVPSPGKLDSAKITNNPPEKGYKEKVRDYHNDTTSLPEPIILGHTGIKEKKVYAHKVKETLKLFRLVAADTRRRGKTLVMDELGCEAHKYMEIYVKPLINDTEANENSETKIEIAKVHLLRAFLYFDIGGYNKARQYVKCIHTNYGKDSYLLGMTIDQKDIGFTTLAEGVKELERKLRVQEKDGK